VSVPTRTDGSKSDAVPAPSDTAKKSVIICCCSCLKSHPDTSMLIVCTVRRDVLQLTVCRCL
jgi:hypothetical protein